MNREELEKLIKDQANDEGLWFKPVYASEAYVCQALEILHEAVSAYLGIIKTDIKRVEEKTGDIIAKKGQKVKFFCCTHDMDSDVSEVMEMEADMTADDLDSWAYDYAHETKQLEWWYEIVDE